MYGEEIALDVSRVDKGVRSRIAKAMELGGSAGLRAQWGLGAFTGEDLPATVHGGVEFALMGGGSTASNRSVILEFDQDGDGAGQKVLHDLFSGRARLENLLRCADVATNVDGTTYKARGDAYAQTYIAGTVAAG